MHSGDHFDSPFIGTGLQSKGNGTFAFISKSITVLMFTKIKAIHHFNTLTANFKSVNHQNKTDTIDNKEKFMRVLIKSLNFCFDWVSGRTKRMTNSVASLGEFNPINYSALNYIVSWKTIASVHNYCR